MIIDFTSNVIIEVCLLRRWRPDLRGETYFRGHDESGSIRLKHESENEKQPLNFINL